MRIEYRDSGAGCVLRLPSFLWLLSVWSLLVMAVLSSCGVDSYNRRARHDEALREQRSTALRALEEALGEGRYAEAVEQSTGVLNTELNDPQDADHAVTEYLYLGVAAALSALDRSDEARDVLRRLTTGFRRLRPETLVVITELELRAGDLEAALCAVESLQAVRGLEYENLRGAAVLYRGLGMPVAAGRAEAAALELAHSRAWINGERYTAHLATLDYHPSHQSEVGPDCEAFGGVTATTGLEAYRVYRDFYENAVVRSSEELDSYAELESYLHRYPGYYRVLLDTLESASGGAPLRGLLPVLERIVLSAPDGPYAVAARAELAERLGLPPDVGRRLLLQTEIEALGRRFLNSGVPETLAPLLLLLDTPDNPYRTQARLLLLQLRELPGVRSYLASQRPTEENRLQESLDVLLSAQ